MPLVPTPPDIAPGVLTTADLTQLVDAVNFLLHPPIAELRQTSAQSIVTTAWTAVQFQSEDLDTDVDGVGGHSNSTNNTRYTARYPGWYELSGGMAWNTGTVGSRAIRWSVNGAFVTGVSHAEAIDTFATCPVARTVKVYLTQGDYVEMYAHHNGGASLSTSVASGEQSTASIRWVSA